LRAKCRGLIGMRAGAARCREPGRRRPQGRLLPSALPGTLPGRI